MCTTAPTAATTVPQRMRMMIDGLVTERFDRAARRATLPKQHTLSMCAQTVLMMIAKRSR